MLARLLAYAGVEKSFELQPFATAELWLPASGAGGVSWQRTPLDHTRAYFAGENPEGVLCFGIDHLSLDQPDELAGLLAHEVAHAWRHHHQLVDNDRALEEELTDLTTIVLGFGLLTVNNAYRERTTLHLEGGLTWTRYSAVRVGYLSAQCLSWLLAVQLEVRDDDELIERLQAALEPNQRRTFREALNALDRDELWKELALPPRERLQFTPFAQPAPVRLPASVSKTAAAPLRPDIIAFRVRAGVSPQVIFATLLIGFLFGAALHSVFPVLVLLGMYVAWVKLVPHYLCAGLDCDGGLEPNERMCRKCGAMIVGEIDRIRDRHDAEKKWRAENGKPAPDDDDDELTRLALGKKD